ncbi:MAG: flavodoxin family protein [Clostridia bacterium]|nr:flavodoxin family protein [Clostridia bacterium]
MKVMLVNGSPHEKGCTYTALAEVAKTLEKEGIETEFFWIGKKPISGCIACGSCTKTGKCAFDDVVNEFTDLAKTADGFVFGSPVYYAGLNGAMMSFMDRVFYTSTRNIPGCFTYKPVAAVVSARRAGTTSAIDQMNKYLMYSQGPIVTSQYWPMVHGNTPDQVQQDAEGLQIMRTLGRNMAWTLKVIEAGKAAGIPYPQMEKERQWTNFIR